jgi:hypothetical protein
MLTAVLWWSVALGPADREKLDQAAAGPLVSRTT